MRDYSYFYDLLVSKEGWVGRRMKVCVCVCGFGRVSGGGDA